MIKQIFLNLPVADLAKSTAFFQALGYALHPQFTGDSAACVVINETTFVMLGTHAKFREFTPKAICDTTQAVEVLINLSCESRQEVDDLVAEGPRRGRNDLRQAAEDFVALCTPTAFSTTTATAGGSFTL